MVEFLRTGADKQDARIKQLETQLAERDELLKRIDEWCYENMDCNVHALLGSSAYELLENGKGGRA